MGAKQKPVYRIVVSDSRKRPTSDVLDEVGFYNPGVDPPEVRVDAAKIEAWRGKGAQMSATVRSLVRKAGKTQ